MLRQVDPGNAQLLDQHLTCAATEAPLLPADDTYFGPGLGAAVTRLMKKSAHNRLPARALISIHNVCWNGAVQVC